MNYTMDEFEEAKQQAIYSLLKKGATPKKNPCCYMTVGQPGAGKTTMARIFNEYWCGDVVSINGDEYRRLHPRYDELTAKYGDEAVLHTQEFAGKMTEALIEELSSRKYNLIIEGTLRTVEVPAKTKFLLEKRGYDVTMAAILVRPEISYLSTIKRYQRMKEFGSVPRQTPKEHHDKVVASIVKNISFLHRSKEFPHIQVYNRKGERLCDTKETPDINPGDIFRQEFERPLSSDERAAIVKDYSAYVSEDKILKVLDEYKVKAEKLQRPSEGRQR